ncbi:hypothetical protein GCM10010191_93790 [Actinomadura vinacea]|uniref:Glycine zipper family protein n=1 Tax=Actinomadura vinacea TaxID=115336 RepID=A0ABN3KJL1_9ACTN
MNRRNNRSAARTAGIGFSTVGGAAVGGAVGFIVGVILGLIVGATVSVAAGVLVGASVFGLGFVGGGFAAAHVARRVASPRSEGVRDA